VLTVTDNGRGPGALRRESGVRNMRDRARSLGGSFALAGGPDSGTVAVWRIPAG